MKADWCQLLVSGKNEGGPFLAKSGKNGALLIMRPSGFEPLTYRLEGTKESPEPRRETDGITVFHRLKRCIGLQR